jgi:sialic acid synthase SpsE
VKARRTLPAGHTLTADDLILLRPATGIEPKHFDDLPGRVLGTAIEAGQALTWDHLT